MLVDTNPAGSRPSASLISSASPSLKSAPRPMERQQSAPVLLTITQSEAAKAGLLTRYKAVLLRRQERRKREASAGDDLQRLISTLIEFAEANGLSRRALLKRAGLSWGSWTRIRDGKVNAVAWLPKLRLAMGRLKPSLTAHELSLETSTLN